MALIGKRRHYAASFRCGFRRFSAPLQRRQNHFDSLASIHEELNRLALIAEHSGFPFST